MKVKCDMLVVCANCECSHNFDGRCCHTTIAVDKNGNCILSNKDNAAIECDSES